MEKDEWLRVNRGVSFELICDKISKGLIVDVLTNPSSKYPHQGVFVIFLMEYTWVVPFFDNGSEIKLITAFPSRKLHKLYGDAKNEK